MTDEDRIDLYDYQLPPELIARLPAERRDASRLLVMSRTTGEIEHRTFSDLPDLLQPGDLLVVNETQVVPARLLGVRTATGGRWEGLFLRAEQEHLWRIIGHTRGKLQPGETLTLTSPHAESNSAPLELELLDKQEDGEWLARPRSDAETLTLLDQFGQMPLPPYMERDAQAVDVLRYQTTYARQPGAVAAPTAGLHFTPELLERCQARGINTAQVTLHVGLGTFRPVSAEKLSEHVMHSEWCHLPQDTVDKIEQTRAAGGRIIAVGTTSVRTLEAVAQQGPLREWSGSTDLFIKPGFEFRVVDQLITNFHLPKSTLLVLVSTFAGRSHILTAYDAAITNRYRFYSYGDAMLIR